MAAHSDVCINSLLREWINNIICFPIRKMSCRSFIQQTVAEMSPLCSDWPCRLCDHSKMRSEGMNDALMLHLVCGCTQLPWEVHKQVIELGPRDNRGVILSVSINRLWEPSVGELHLWSWGKCSPQGSRKVW